MTNSNHSGHIDQAKYQVSQFLEDENERVMVIRGSYGSGKSYFLRDYYLAENCMPEDSPKWLAYTSVFGVNSIKELQSTTVGSLERRSNNKGARRKNQKAGKLDIGLNVVQKLLKPFIGGVNIELSATSLIWAIAKRAGMLLIIDDIDRNSGSLKLNDLIGFVSAMTEHAGGKTKAILVLHDDELVGEDRDTWAKLREKIVDREITFAPDIRSTAFHYVKTKNLKEPISNIHSALGSHNIRTMLKIEALVNRTNIFFDDHHITLHDSEKMAITYNASLFYLCKVDFSATELSEAYLNRSPLSKKEDTQTVLALRKLVDNLDYFASKDFASICLQFFKTGSVDPGEMERFKSNKSDRKNKEKKQQILSDFWRHLNGDFSDKKKQIIDHCNTLFNENIDLLKFYDVRDITDMVDFLGEPTLHLFKIWVDHNKGNEDDIRKLAEISAIFPTEFKPVESFMSYTVEDVRKKFLDELKAYYLNRDKFFSQELLLVLETWTPDDFVKFFLNVEDPDLLVSIRSVLSVNWDNMEKMTQIVPHIKTALRTIRETSKLNEYRVDHCLN